MRRLAQHGSSPSIRSCRARIRSPSPSKKWSRALHYESRESSSLLHMGDNIAWSNEAEITKVRIRIWHGLGVGCWCIATLRLYTWSIRFAGTKWTD